MKERTKEFSIHNLNIRRAEIWKIVSDTMNKRSKTWKNMSDVQVKNTVKKLSVKASGCDMFRVLER